MPSDLEWIRDTPYADFGTNPVDLIGTGDGKVRFSVAGGEGLDYQSDFYFDRDIHEEDQEAEYADIHVVISDFTVDGDPSSFAQVALFGRAEPGALTFAAIAFVARGPGADRTFFSLFSGYDVINHEVDDADLPFPYRVTLHMDNHRAYLLINGEEIGWAEDYGAGDGLDGLKAGFSIECWGSGDPASATIEMDEWGATISPRLVAPNLIVNGSFEDGPNILWDPEWTAEPGGAL